MERKVADMCSYATAMEIKGVAIGIEKGIEEYSNVSREEVNKYYR